MAAFKFDEAQFARFAKELGAVKRFTEQEMIRYLGKIYIRYLMQVTPPFGRSPFAANNWQEQKKIGEDSAKRDIDKLVQPCTLYSIERFTGKLPVRDRINIRKAIAGKNLNEVKRLILKLSDPGQTETGDLSAHLSSRRTGKDWDREAKRLARIEKRAAKKKKNPISTASLPKIIQRVTYELIKRQINFSRRPHKIRHRFLVLDANSIKNMKIQAVAHIGTAKAGWLKSAEVLGWKGAPKWVTRQRGRYQGNVLDQLHDQTNPSITMINSTLGAAGDDIDVVNVAKAELLRSGVMKQLEHIGRKRVARFNSGQRQTR